MSNDKDLFKGVNEATNEVWRQSDKLSEALAEVGRQMEKAFTAANHSTQPVTVHTLPTVNPVRTINYAGPRWYLFKKLFKAAVTALFKGKCTIVTPVKKL